MTDQQPTRPVESRLTAVEIGHRHLRREIAEIKARNKEQDQDREQIEQRLLEKIAEINTLLWSGMKWLAAFLCVTLCGIILRALQLG